MIKRAIVFATIIGVAVTTIPLVGSPSAAGSSSIRAGRVRSQFQPNKGKLYILVIGNDARFGNPDRVRADALHVIGINTKTMRAGILNFPRDSYVNIPGRGSGRINEALFRGGPGLQVRTIENITGIKIDYWIMTGFQGFRAIMKDIRGVKMNIPRAIHDPGGSGANIKAGRRWLSAEPALGFVRTRKSIAGGDIARTTNQAKFLIALLRKFRERVAQNPGTLLSWMATTQKHTRLNLSAEEMFRLGVLATQLAPRRVKSVTVPVSFGSVGAASVVYIQPRAQSIYARLRRNASF